MGKFAVIDIETTWSGHVMSIGLVIADDKTMEIIDKFYYLIDPFYKYDGMYSSVLKLPGVKITSTDKRYIIIKAIKQYFNDNEIKKVLAYNAKFDYNHLPELQDYEWYDIMRFAAYKEYNIEIKKTERCFSSGRLIADFGVENMFRLLAKNKKYYEKHNALCDAEDELKIVKLLGYNIEFYKYASIDINNSRYSGKSDKRILEIYNEKINKMTAGKIAVLKFDKGTFEAQYRCNLCGYEWKTRTASFYKESNCPCKKCLKK